MSHKKRKINHNIDIENALLNLKFPLLNNCNAKVNLKTSESTHSRSKHISKKYHGLLSKDIKLIPITLSEPDYVILDPVVKHNKNYYKKRNGEKKILFLKIVTKIIDANNEELITIYTTNKIKGRLKRKK